MHSFPLRLRLCHLEEESASWGVRAVKDVTLRLPRLTYFSTCVVVLPLQHYF